MSFITPLVPFAERRKMKTAKPVKYLIFFCSIFLFYTFVNADSNINRSNDLYTEPYIYPVLPGSEEWENFTDVEQKRSAVNVGEEVLNMMTTEALVETVITYPFFIDIYAYNSIEEGICHLGTYFKGVDILLNRSDAVDELLSYANRKNLSSDDPKSIYVNTLVSYINPPLKRIKLHNCELNYTASHVYTPNGSEVDTIYNYTWDDFDMTQAHAELLNSVYLSAYSSATLGSGVNSAYNCHSFAWYSQLPTNKHWMPTPVRYFTDMSYTMTSSHTVGNRITYTTSTDYDHSGIIYSMSGSTPVIKSKWGVFGVFIHNYNDCPYYTTSTYIRYWH